MQKLTNFNYIGNIGIRRNEGGAERGGLLKTGELAITSNLGLTGTNNFGSNFANIGGFNFGGNAGLNDPTIGNQEIGNKTTNPWDSRRANRAKNTFGNNVQINTDEISEARDVLKVLRKRDPVEEINKENNNKDLNELGNQTSNTNPLSNIGSFRSNLNNLANMNVNSLNTASNTTNLNLNIPPSSSVRNPSAGIGTFKKTYTGNLDETDIANKDKDIGLIFNRDKSKPMTSNEGFKADILNQLGSNGNGSNNYGTISIGRKNNTNENGNANYGNSMKNGLSNMNNFETIQGLSNTITPSTNSSINPNFSSACKDTNIKPKPGTTNELVRIKNPVNKNFSNTLNANTATRERSDSTDYKYITKPSVTQGNIKNQRGNTVDKQPGDVDERPAYATGKKVEPEADEMIDEDENGIECEMCGRKFNVKSFEKHAKNCRKVFQSKRKTFQSKNKRILDSEHAMLVKQAEQEDKKKSKMGFNKDKESSKLKQTVTQKVPKWKVQSEQFRNQVKASVANGENKGEDKVKENPNSELLYAGTITCEMCSKNYNPEPYKKHLNFCKKRYDRENMKTGEETQQKAVSLNTANVNNNSNQIDTKNGSSSKALGGPTKPSFNVKFSK